MQILSHPVEIWIAASLAVLVKLTGLKGSTTIGIFGTATTILVALLSGVIFYIPIMELLSLGSSWAIPTAILIALTAENIMKTIVELSSDGVFIRKIADGILNRFLPAKKD